MDRRKFLVGTATGAAALAGLSITGGAQAPAAPAQGRGQGQGQAGRGGAFGGRGNGGGTPARVPAAKLARVSIMTLNFSSMLKFPWTQNPNESQTLSVLDLPQMYRDSYGVDHIEFQHNHLVDTSGNQTQRAPDLAFFRDMKTKLDAARMTCSQVNIELGVIPNLTGEARANWMASAKRWVDAAPILGCTRLMLNQTGLNQENKANCISVWKEIQDYATPKGTKISAETRGTGGGGGGRGRAQGAADAPPPPPPTPQQVAANVHATCMLLEEVIEAAGAYSNVDMGNVGAQNQQQLHDCIKILYPRSSGNCHLKNNVAWDMGEAVRYTESLGYRGLYSIEVNGHGAVRQVYNEILANVKNTLA